MLKKLIIGSLVLCLMIGIPFVIMGVLAARQGVFNISSDFERIKLPLNEIARDNEIVYTKELTKAIELKLELQSDAPVPCQVTISSDKKLMGSASFEKTYYVTNLTGYKYVTDTLLLQPGNYVIRVSNQIYKGNLMIGFKETERKDSDYDRLLKIDQGALDNPPKDYELIYHADLSTLNCEDETVYQLTLDYSQLIGLSAYTNATKGNVSVNLIGDYSSYYGLLSPGIKNICDQLENQFSKGEYQVQITSKNADGELYLFLKR